MNCVVPWNVALQHKIITLNGEKDNINLMKHVFIHYAFSPRILSTITSSILPSRPPYFLFVYMWYTAARQKLWPILPKLWTHYVSLSAPKTVYLALLESRKCRSFFVCFVIPIFFSFLFRERRVLCYLYRRLFISNIHIHLT